MRLVNLTKTSLIEYTINQISNFFPSENKELKKIIEKNIDESLNRLRICINSIRCWNENEFNYLQSSQYCTYLYFLANTIWKNNGNEEVCTKLFLLNKALNGIDCFYEIELPEKFYIPHTIGVVLAKATYSNNFVIYQNSTVGKNHGIAPIIGERVVMYPNTAIIGRSNIGHGTILAQGTRVVNKNCYGNSVVFNSNKSEIINKPLKRNIITDIFKI